ncbi:MAG TPA: YraN family protein [Candidatus Peribacterales bacterium]|nr:YraN family protein [Candidatus Peribacterales bacterium]
MQLFSLAEIPVPMVRCTSVHLSSMAESHIETGKRGEDCAAAYLTLRGYRILQRNIRTQAGEIDLIARLGDTIIFVEVKANARTHDAFAPSIRVDQKKLNRLSAAAELWLELERERGADLSGRIDVIGVCEGKVVEHFEDVAG